MMQQLLESMFRSMLQSQGLSIPAQGFTLEHVSPDGRADAQISHLMYNVCSANMLTAAMFNVARPIVDTTLQKALGLKAISANVQAEAKAEKPKVEVVGHVFLDKMETPKRKRKSKGLKTKDRIIDAEFVAVNEKAKVRNVR
jgi:hypothetical protein